MPFPTASSSSLSTHSRAVLGGQASEWEARDQVSFLATRLAALQDARRRLDVAVVSVQASDFQAPGRSGVAATVEAYAQQREQRQRIEEYRKEIRAVRAQRDNQERVCIAWIGHSDHW